MKINNKTSQSIGFIGAGNMGLPMLKNLIKVGYEVKVYDINPKITKKLEKEKIKSVNNLRGIANSNFIISILPDTNDVENVFNVNYRNYLNRLRFFATEVGRISGIELNYTF